MNPVRHGHVLVRPRRQSALGESLLVTIGTDFVRADGILDELTVDLLLAAADFLFTRGSRTVTLDLTHIRRIDSDAVRELFTPNSTPTPASNCASWSRRTCARGWLSVVSMTARTPAVPARPT